MVHALERARHHLVQGGALVLVQPHQLKRPSIAIVSPRARQPIAMLVNPLFQPLIDSANDSIRLVTEEGQFTHTGTSHHRLRVRLANPSQLHRYLHQHGGQRPPRFPPGARRLMRQLWDRRGSGAQLEVTEFMTVIGLRAS